MRVACHGLPVTARQLLFPLRPLSAGFAGLVLRNEGCLSERSARDEEGGRFSGCLQSALSRL